MKGSHYSDDISCVNKNKNSNFHHLLSRDSITRLDTNSIDLSSIDFRSAT